MLNSNSYPRFAGTLTGDGVIRELEHRFAGLLNEHFHCLSVVNATSGLAAILSIIPPGRVLTTLYTSPATYAAIGHAGHEITFCDIDPVTLCLSPQAVRREINNDVRAIVTVNIFGHRSDLSALGELADQAGALLILDAAQSLATCLSNPEYTGQADLVVFSLGPNKWIGAPDGGLVAVRSASLWDELVLITQHEYRQILDVPEREPNFEHFNYRINPFSAKLALKALEDIKTDIDRVRQEQQQLIDQLTKVEEFEPLPVDKDVFFEPLTVMPRCSEINTWILHGLPIPPRLAVAGEYHLTETLRQFRYRKVLVRPYPEGL